MIENRLSGTRITGALLAAGIGIAALGSGCSSADKAVSDVTGFASGCSEWKGGVAAVQGISIDGDTKAFVVASATLVQTTTQVEKDVLGACIAIAGDLQISDTWSAKAPTAGAAPDDEVKEACGQVATKIQAIVASVQAHCHLAVYGAQCTVDEQTLTTCESTCTNTVSCTPGDVTTYCQQGELTGQCSGSCNAMAVCEGSVMAAAQCSGSCAGDCTGMCDSTMVSGAYCAGTCVGTCTGNCTISASGGASCGASVNCRGGCSVAYTEPKCETAVTPPTCMVSSTCQKSCESQTRLTRVCTPPGASLECDASVDVTTGDIKNLVGTVKSNLGPIVQLAKTDGTLLVSAAKDVADTAEVVKANARSLSGKDIACGTAAVEADATVVTSLDVSVTAGANVSTACGAGGS